MPAATNKQMSCIASRTMILYIERRLGQAGVGELVQAAGLPEEFLRDQHNFMAFDTAQAMSERCKELLKNPQAPLVIARESAAPGVVGPVLAMAHALGSPRAAYRLSPRLNRQFTRVVEMELEELARGRARIRARYVGVEPHKNDCLYRQGVLGAIPTIWGLPPAEIREECCAAEGASECLYEISWRPLSRRHRLLLASVALLAALASALSMIFLPSLSLYLVPIAIGILSLLGLRLDRIIRRERAAKREEYDALESELRTVERKGDALEQAKAELETRVEALRAAQQHVREVSALLDASAIHPATLRRIVEATRATTGILLVPKKDGCFSIAAAHGCQSEPDAGETIPSGEKAMLDRIRELGLLDPSLPLLLRPLEHGDKLMGFVVLAREDDDTGPAFNAATIEVAELLAAQAAVAMENARLYDLAITDGMTGLFIHRHFVERLDQELSRADRYQFPIALLMLDLDHFKKTNDRFGHLAGDLVLKETADTIRKGLRAKIDLVARYGGEEFAVILPQTDREGAIQAAEKIRQAVALQDTRHDGNELPVTVSIGVALGNGRPRLPVSEFVRRADDALYEAKRNGRNRVELYCTQEDSNSQPTDP